RHLPEPETELEYHDPFQLLVSVILSAQCTDKRVNLVTPALFNKFPEPRRLAVASFEEVFPFIKSVSYPNNKTRHLIAMAQMLVEKFNSRVPSSTEDLQKLPGVGRKTAHVIASVIYNKPVLAVDTHVFRVSRRIGLASEKSRTPLAVERDLVKYIPREMIHNAHHWLILHGRYVCTARKPDCKACGIRKICRFYKINGAGNS
ncbi:MAG TPA: endonuclease III, partial [Cyclobacteriaceae bacterium]|nr:endonuclease III [Cyclobacteriaceae bacterium]